MKPIVSLQCMRAVAAILVVVFHHMNAMRSTAAPNLPRFDIGEFGVDIFFVISGFIMWTTTVRGKSTGLDFMRRRIIRIVPLYWALTIVTVFVSTKSGLSLNLDVDYIRLVKSLLFIPQWHDVFPMVAPYLIVGWTLEAEMMFYVVFASALHLPPARRLYVMLGALVLLTAIGLAFAPRIAVVKGWTNDIIMEFGMGVVLGRLHELRRAPKNKAVGLVLVLAGVVMVAFHAQLPQLRFVYFGIPAFLIMTGVLALEDFFVGGAFRLPKFLGDASYSIYLSHLMAMAISTRLVPRSFAGEHVVPVLVLEVVFAVAVGCAVYVVLEKRLTEWARRLLTEPSRREPVVRGL